MQQFKWGVLVSDELVTSICDVVKADKKSTTEVVRKLLIRLFEIAGGFPLSQRPLTDDACSQIAKGLLDDAIRESFAEDIFSLQSTGIILEDCDKLPLKSQILLGDFVHINWCTEKELSSLPGIKPKIAQKIIDERYRNGAFKSGKDLTTRVSGIGERTAIKILRRLRFNQRPTVMPSSQDIFELLKMLVDRTGATPEEGLRRILEYSITYLGDRTQMRWYADQHYYDNPPAIPHACSWIGILRGNQYYYWLSEAFDKAEKIIDMAMFHAAMPAVKHPTRILVDKLIAAKNRGVSVRILLDRDREKDVYESTVINTNVLEALRVGGVDARFDSEDKLLHSKFLVLDSETSILGSHNWSAGSYFQYDDVTMVINSESFAQELRQRFEQLWLAT